VVFQLMLTTHTLQEHLDKPELAARKLLKDILALLEPPLVTQALMQSKMQFKLKDQLRLDSTSTLTS